MRRRLLATRSDSRSGRGHAGGRGHGGPLRHLGELAQGAGDAALLRARRRPGAGRAGGAAAGAARRAGGRVARRLRLPAHLRGPDALHRPLPLAGAASATCCCAARRCPTRRRSTASSTRPARRSACWSATPTSTTPSTPRRSPGGSAARPTARRSLVNLMGLHGLAERAVEVEPYRTYELGPFEVSFTPSVHSKLLLGLAVPYDGELTCEHLDALSPGAYRCGQVWGISIAVAGVALLPPGQRQPDRRRDRASARSTSSSPASPAAASPTTTGERILPRLDPRAVVPTHYDNFFRPLGQELEFVANVAARRAAGRDRRGQPRDRDRRAAARRRPG